MRQNEGAKPNDEALTAPLAPPFVASAVGRLALAFDPPEPEEPLEAFGPAVALVAPVVAVAFAPAVPLGGVRPSGQTQV